MIAIRQTKRMQIFALTVLCATAIEFQNTAKAGFLEDFSAPRILYDFNKSVVNGSAATDMAHVVNMDVFWCQGDERAEYRALEASEIATSLATASQFLLVGADFKMGQVRTRPVEWGALANSLTEQILDAISRENVLLFSGEDPNSAGLVARLGPALGLKKVVSVPAERYTPNYVSIYVCLNPDIGRVYGQLYIQVKDATLKLKATETLGTLRAKNLGLKVSTGIEIVGDRSPLSSELRYFFPDDRDLAARVADDLSTSFDMLISPRYIEGYEGKVRQGTLEAWITR